MSWRYISLVLCYLAITAATVRVAICERQTPMTLSCYGPGIPTKVVAGPGEGQWNTTQVGFGSVIVFDQRLTETPDSTSRYLGQVRGIIVIDALAGTSMMDVLVLDFANDQFNGSVSLFGTENLLTKSRVVPIAGGSGHFLFAKGYAIFEQMATYNGESTNDELVVAGFHITLHYKKAASLEDF